MQREKNRKKSTLRNVFISTAVIVFFLGILSIFYALLYSETYKKITVSCELSSISSAEQIDKYLSKGSDTLKIVSYTVDEMIRSNKTQSEIHEYLVNQSSAILNLNIGNDAGIYGYVREEYLDGFNWVPDEDYVPVERPWYIDARAHVGRVAVVDPYIDSMTGNIIITLCKTLCDAKSVISMDFSMERLQEITESVIKDDKVDAEIVLDQQYRVIAHSDASEINKNYLSEENTFGSTLVEQLRIQNSGFFSFKYSESEYIVYATSVANEWLCLSIFDATKTFSQLRTTLIFSILVSIVVIIILLLIMINSNKKQNNYDRLSNVVEALAAAIDAKDVYTNGHSVRVAIYSKEISRRHGDSKKVQDEIYMMGLLHDVGKIGIPDTVINKPGKLTNEEFEVIKTHPEIGNGILSKASSMPELAAGVHWHHERYDGTGYPDRLKGEDIPERARIIAVADAYDAMTSKRSYRDGLPQDVVRAEIEKGKGIQFDPVYANIMLEMIDEDKDFKLRSDS